MVETGSDEWWSQVLHCDDSDTPAVDDYNLQDTMVGSVRWFETNGTHIQIESNGMLHDFHSALDAVLVSKTMYG